MLASRLGLNEFDHEYSVPREYELQLLTPYVIRTVVLYVCSQWAEASLQIPASPGMFMDFDGHGEIAGTHTPHSIHMYYIYQGNPTVCTVGTAVGDFGSEMSSLITWSQLAVNAGLSPCSIS